jgi:hypothetical protein
VPRGGHGAAPGTIRLDRPTGHRLRLLRRQRWKCAQASKPGS